MKRKLLLLITTAFIAVSSLPVMVLASDLPAGQNTAAVSEDTITPRKDIIDYQYTVFNNVLYRRLYNFTKNIPLSDWEIVP